MNKDSDDDAAEKNTYKIKEEPGEYFDFLSLQILLNRVIDAKYQTIVASNKNKWFNILGRKSHWNAKSRPHCKHCECFHQGNDEHEIRRRRRINRRNRRGDKYFQDEEEEIEEMEGDILLGSPVEHHNLYDFDEESERGTSELTDSRLAQRNYNFAHTVDIYDEEDDTLRNLDSPIELQSNDSLLDLSGFDGSEQPSSPQQKRSLNYPVEYPELYQSAYFTPSAENLKIMYDDKDYIAVDIDDELKEYDDLDECETSFNGNKNFLNDSKYEEKSEKYHRDRRKRKRYRNEDYDEIQVLPDEEEEEPEVPEVYLDPNEISPRAKNAIVITACVLLAMSVGIVVATLRMAPIIDDMGDGRRASVKRKVSARRTNSINRKNSTRQTNNNKTYHYRSDAEIVNDDNKIKVVEKSLMELEQARKQRQIIIIILGIFVILVVTSVLIVIITLTRRSFRTSIGTPRSSHHNYSMRLQNEELINSLHRHRSTITNSTIPP